MPSGSWFVANQLQNIPLKDAEDCAMHSMSEFVCLYVWESQTFTVLWPCLEFIPVSLDKQTGQFKAGIFCLRTVA